MLTAMPAHPIIHCNVKQHCNAPQKLSNFSMYSQLVVPMCQERVGRYKKLPADANLYVIKTIIHLSCLLDPKILVCDGAKFDDWVPVLLHACQF